MSETQPRPAPGATHGAADVEPTTSSPRSRPRSPRTSPTSDRPREGRRTSWSRPPSCWSIGLAGAWLAYGYGLGTLRRPGPGLWPFIVSCLIVVLAVVLWSSAATSTTRRSSRGRACSSPVGAATFVALGFLLPVIGFEIPAVLLGIVWLRFLGGESWRSTIVISVLTTAAFYGLFLYALSVPLPHLIAL